MSEQMTEAQLEAWGEKFEADVKRALAQSECDLEPCRSKYEAWTR